MSTAQLLTLTKRQRKSASAQKVIFIVSKWVRENNIRYPESGIIDFIVLFHGIIYVCALSFLICLICNTFSEKIVSLEIFSSSQIENKVTWTVQIPPYRTQNNSHKKPLVKREDGTKVRNSGKGGYDVISSDKGFNEGIHKWTIKCLEIDWETSVCIGVVTKTDFRRKEGSKTDDLIIAKETGDGCLFVLCFPKSN